MRVTLSWWWANEVTCYNLPDAKLTPSRGASSSCSICLKTFSWTEKVLTLHCGHGYHGRCVMPWLTSHGRSTCPLCVRCVKLNEICKQVGDLEKWLSWWFTNGVVRVLFVKFWYTLVYKKPYAENFSTPKLLRNFICIPLIRAEGQTNTIFSFEFLTPYLCVPYSGSKHIQPNNIKESNNCPVTGNTAPIGVSCVPGFDLFS